MAILKVARMGNPVLRRVADPVPPDQISSAPIQRLIRDMLDTVVEYDGVGLAAPQVHQSVRIVLLTFEPEEGFEVWINPVLTPTTDETAVHAEGCLSIPGLRGDVRRPAAVHVTGYDHLGNQFERDLDGFPAVVAQHECDHLDGVLYVDKVDHHSLSFLEEWRRFQTAEDHG